ncbi:hypothetical protein Trydic_g17240 [Trypoxylus dichotomus]
MSKRERIEVAQLAAYFKEVYTGETFGNLLQLKTSQIIIRSNCPLKKTINETRYKFAVKAVKEYPRISTRYNSNEIPNFISDSRPDIPITSENGCSCSDRKLSAPLINFSIDSVSSFELPKNIRNLFQSFHYRIYEEKFSLPKKEREDITERMALRKVVRKVDMAEAHQAVAFPYIIRREGWDVNVDQEALELVWRSGVRSWKKRFARFMNNVHNGIYPGRLWTLWIFMSVIMAIHYSGYKIPYDLVRKILPYLPGSDLKWQLVGSAITATFIWIVTIYAVRYTLKLLFMYKGWMYEARNKTVSSKTKLWICIIRILSSWNKPKLYSLQGSIPKLPLPSLKQTLTRYLKSVRPFVNNEKYQRITILAKEFEEGIGNKLQRYLVLKSWWSTNYVSDWWEEYVYLRGRSPLMINSNFYGMDALTKKTTTNQAARAASVINATVQFRKMIERQELKPLMIRDCIPLCSSQYERVFNTTRIPGIEADQIVHWKDSNHIAVYHRGRYFKVIIKSNGILNPREMQEQIQQILDDTSVPQPGEKELAALTAGNRTEWAKIRRCFFNKGVNKTSLDTIEKAAFFLSLDDEPYLYEPKHPEKLDRYGKILLHGKGYDRWFDKSFTLCIGNNGKMGVNCEHTWGDAPISTQIWEFIITEELKNRFTESGDVVGEIDKTPPPPIRLQWELKPDCIAQIENAARNAQSLIDDLDLKIYAYDQYGKGFIKTCGVSPDAYIQLALQLAYYRDTAWVWEMENKKNTVEEKIKLLRVACEKHQRNYLDAMCGKGVDRHLFCLYVVSKYLEIDSPFLQEVLNEPWRLSTSQSPFGQTGLDLKKYPECISSGGGFGPVADDGYGISYIVAGEDAMFFHISNKKSSKVTDCRRFAKKLEDALFDMNNLFTSYDNANYKS